MGSILRNSQGKDEKGGPTSKGVGLLLGEKYSSFGII
jgi:hypothetical protein